MVDEGHKEEMLLGRNTPAVDRYAPELLYPIPRSRARNELGLANPLPFSGVDLWHAYELSWLDTTGKPVVRVGRFTVPATSPFMVESKSFKLYLNSLNQVRFAGDDEAVQTILRDVGAVAGEPVELALWPVEDPGLCGDRLSGDCLDHLDVTPRDAEPDARMLTVGHKIVEEQVHSHLLRSLCPVTGQPDWASVWVHYRGRALDRVSLLEYIIAYRQHQEFHEQCVERMFRDISERCEPQFLHLQAFYTRRGGMDINPFRSTDPTARPRPRLNRQ